MKLHNADVHHTSYKCTTTTYHIFYYDMIFTISYTVSCKNIRIYTPYVKVNAYGAPTYAMGFVPLDVVVAVPILWRLLEPLGFQDHLVVPHVYG